MASTADSKALAGLRSILITDKSFEEQLFLAHARRLFLRYHRAQAERDSTDIRPYLEKQLRRDFDASVSGGTRISPVAGVRKMRIIDASDEEVAGERIVVRFVALDAEQSAGVLAEDWTFDRSTAMARWTARVERTECPTCGGPRVRGAEVCEYCGIPLASGGWLVTSVDLVSLETTTTLSRQALVAILAVSALVMALAGLAVVLAGGDDQSGSTDVARSSLGTVPVDGVSTAAGAGAPGLAELTLAGGLSGTRSGEARTIGGDGTCASVARFAGFSVTALPGTSVPGTLTMGIALPDTKSGPGVYDGSISPSVTIVFQRTDPDGTSVTQSWDEGGLGAATLEVAQDGSMVLVFSGYTPKTSSADPALNADVGGTVTFTCTG